MAELTCLHSDLSIHLFKPQPRHTTVIIAFHKPYGVLCQFTPDRPGQRTLADFGFPKGVYAIGRLDMDSEGLLLLSDESRLNGKILNPKNAHPRSYLIQVEGIPDEEDLTKLSGGSLVIKTHRCLPCSVERFDPQPEIPGDVPQVVKTGRGWLG